MILLDVLAAYAMAGAAIAVAFMAFGMSRVLPQASMTIGARILVLPGAIALWPFVLARWLQRRGSR